MNHTATYPPKSLRSAMGGYRYFFNGQEADNEVLGKGSLAGYEFRQYDTRLGRWWGVDRKAAKYPSLSPYQFCAGNPIWMKDVDGSDFVVSIDNSGKEKTITIQMNIYTASQEAYDKLLPAVKEINDITKKVTIDGVEYKLRFAINAVKPDPTAYHDYEKDSSPEDQMRANASAMANQDGCYDNAFMGTWVRNNEKEQEDGMTLIKGGYISDGKVFSMNAYGGVYFINYPKIIAHEILHMLGLDDKGGKYYSPGGRMEYVAKNSNDFYMNPISNNDILNIIRYMLDNNGFDVEKHPKVKINYLNDSEPIQSYTNIEVE